MQATEFGIGVYSLAEAARLIHAERRSLDRWMFGYDYRRKDPDGERHQCHSDPLWQPQHGQPIAGEKVIGFRDLLELRIVREFVSHGVSLLVVRRCLEVARSIYNIGEFPLSTRRFCTDGKTIFQEVVRDGTEPEILDLRSRQYVIREIIKPSLYAGIEYEGDLARRWFPNGNKRDVVIDPELQFGKPVLLESGVPTAAIYAAYLAEERDAVQVARMYEIPKRMVDAAVKFEERLAA